MSALTSQNFECIHSVSHNSCFVVEIIGLRLNVLDIKQEFSLTLLEKERKIETQKSFH